MIPAGKFPEATSPAGRAMIEGNGFEQLEERIGQAISRIRELQSERDALRARVATLEQEQQELEEQIRQVRAESIPRNEYEEKKRAIEQRVESLLKRFGELDSLKDATTVEPVQAREQAAD